MGKWGVLPYFAWFQLSFRYAADQAKWWSVSIFLHLALAFLSRQEQN